MKLGRFAIAAALVGAAFGSQASVLEWGYSNNSTFSIAAYNAGSGATNSTPSELSWGSSTGNFTAGDTGNASNNRSALTIGTGEFGNARFGGGPASASSGVFTNFGGPLLANQIGLGVTMTHWNNPLDGNFRTLTSATLSDTLNLTPFNPAGSSFDVLPALSFSFQFRETPNNGPCAGGTATPCGDLFGFSGTPNLNIAFDYLGEDYFASILILGPNFSTSPIAFLNDGQCAALGFTTGTSGMRCQGFLTAENAATTVRFGFVITADPISVPEPGSIALMGLALAALGYASKRKNV
ncbi:MAG: THxN family PEP-CTERM protein [Azonexus sp.]|nr:THxN family PEP-CTERM protein [Azonexus sp.]